MKRRIRRKKIKRRKRTKRRKIKRRRTRRRKRRRREVLQQVTPVIPVYLMEIGNFVIKE